MIGIDTNVLVRYIVQDDARQSRTATRFIEKTLSADNRGFVSAIVLCEVVWVLRRAYRQSKQTVLAVLQRSCA